MKKSIAVLSFLFSLLFIASCEKETVIAEQEIPTEIKDYVSTHFPDCTISKAIKDNDDDEVYEITLSCGIKLEFNKEKTVIDIDGTSKLPDSVVPAPILSYVTLNYPNNYIIGWEIEGSNQKVELNNDVTLIFDAQGGFLRVED